MGRGASFFPGIWWLRSKQAAMHCRLRLQPAIVRFHRWRPKRKGTSASAAGERGTSIRGSDPGLSETPQRSPDLTRPPSFSVSGDRIELSTRGFSIPAPRGVSREEHWGKRGRLRGV
jgi:hypothetical protein